MKSKINRNVEILALLAWNSILNVFLMLNLRIKKKQNKSIIIVTANQTQYFVFIRHLSLASLTKRFSLNSFLL